MRSVDCTARATRYGASPPPCACATGPSSVTAGPIPARTDPRASQAERPGLIRGVHRPAAPGGVPEHQAELPRVAGDGIPRRQDGPAGLRPEGGGRIGGAATRNSYGACPADRRWLGKLGDDDGEIGEAIDLAGKFAGLIRGRLTGELSDWLFRARASLVAALRSFARSLRLDELAVRAGVSNGLPSITGPLLMPSNARRCR
jgi:hypothetical protein